MHLLIHDYGGYAFPLELSVELARRGHDVTHAYCASLQTTPPGIGGLSETPDSFRLHPIRLNEPINKYNLARRWMQERQYGRAVSAEYATLSPDLVLSANTPLDAQRPLLQACKRNKTPFIFWLQDLLGVATHRILKRKIPVAGAWVGQYYMALEQRLLASSDAVVAITEDFMPVLRASGVSSAKSHIIPNWASLRTFVPGPKDNAWVRQQPFADTFCYLYAGTLGMKHNPDLLLQLAVSLRDVPDASVVVVSQGLGASWLLEQKDALGLTNLFVLPYQPVEMVPSMLASADVLVALLEPDAGTYSVPSKIMTYLCMEKPLLLALPASNRAAHLVRDACGCVVEPQALDRFLDAAHMLRADETLRERYGKAARQYAETHFNITTITDTFEAVMNAVHPNP